MSQSIICGNFFYLREKVLLEYYVLFSSQLNF